MDKLQWSRVPRAKNLLLLEDLGVGHSGRVWLVCSKSGLVGVLKFSVAEPKKAWTGALDDFREQKLQTELKWWKQIYPELGQMCSVQKFAGCWTLLMPHLCSPQRNEIAVNGVRETLQDCFADKGLEHGDVAWRNIGVFEENGEAKYIVYDLESVKVNSSADWVDVAVEELEKRC